MKIQTKSSNLDCVFKESIGQVGDLLLVELHPVLQHAGLHYFSQITLVYQPIIQIYQILVMLRHLDISDISNAPSSRYFGYQECSVIQIYQILGMLRHLDISDIRNAPSSRYIGYYECSVIQIYWILGMLRHLDILDIRNTPSSRYIGYYECSVIQIYRIL